MESSDKLKYSLIYSEKAIYINDFDYLDKIFEKETVKLDGNCSDDELMGVDNKVPNWYLSLVARASEVVSILKIDLSDVSDAFQLRFMSIIKDRTISSYVLPKNCKILVVSNDMSYVNSELLSYMEVIK